MGTKIIWYKHSKEKNSFVECDESEGVLWCIVDENHKKITEAINVMALKGIHLADPRKRIHWPDGEDSFDGAGVDKFELDDLWFSKAEADFKYQYEKKREEAAFPLLLGERYMDQKKKETFKRTCELEVDMSSPPRDLEMQYYDQYGYMTHKTIISYKSGKRTSKTEYFPKMEVPRMAESIPPTLWEQIKNIFR